MSIIAKQGGSSNAPKKVVPSGSHVARCYGMIQIGTLESEWAGEKKVQHKVMIDWELPLELAVFKEGEGEKPFVISKEFTLSFHEMSALRKYLQSWRGKPFTDSEANAFDISKLIGSTCMLNIIHKASTDGSKTYANIAGISPIPKGLTCPDQINATRLLSYSDWNQEVFMGLPDWLAEKIASTPEYKAKFAMNTAPTLDVVWSDDNEGDGLPF